MAATEEIPKVPVPGNRDLATFLQSNADEEFFSGNRPWFALIITMMIFDTGLGE